MSVLPIMPVSETVSRQADTGTLKTGGDGAAARANAANAASGQQATNLTSQATTQAQSASAQAVLTLIKLLGRPLSGTVLPGPQVASGGEAAAQAPSSPASQNATAPQQRAIPVQLSVENLSAPRAQSAVPTNTPQPGGQPATPQQIETLLPLPREVRPPQAGSAIRVSAPPSNSGFDLQIEVLRNGPPPSPQAQLRADLARQTSPAPMAADLLALRSSVTGNQPLDAAIERVVGHILKPGPAQSSPAQPAPAQPGTQVPVSAQPGTQPPGPAQPGFQATSAGGKDAFTQTLRQVLAPLSASSASAPLQTSAGSGSGSGLQGAVAALVRALGIAMNQQTGSPTSPITTASPAGNQTAGQPNPGQANLGQPNSGQPSPGQPASPAQAGPSKLTAQALPAPPDLADPVQRANLLAKAEGALSRINAMAALDQQTVPSAARGEPAATLPQTQQTQPTQQLARLDIPMLIGQEAAVLGVAIEADRDEGRSGPDAAVKAWRFRFAFEARDAGGVEGVVALQTDPNDSRSVIDVGVWASDEDMLVRLKAHRAALSQHLNALGLTVASLTVAETEKAASSERSPVETASPYHAVDVRS